MLFVLNMVLSLFFVVIMGKPALILDRRFSRTQMRLFGVGGLTLSLLGLLLPAAYRWIVELPVLLGLLFLFWQAKAISAR